MNKGGSPGTRGHDDKRREVIISDIIGSRNTPTGAGYGDAELVYTCHQAAVQFYSVWKVH